MDHGCVDLLIIIAGYARSAQRRVCACAATDAPGRLTYDFPPYFPLAFALALPSPASHRIEKAANSKSTNYAESMAHLSRD